MTKIKEVSEQEIGIFIDKWCECKKETPCICEWQNYLKDDETRTVLKVIVSDFELCGEKRTENQKPMEEKEPFPKTAETEEIDF